MHANHIVEMEKRSRRVESRTQATLRPPKPLKLGLTVIAGLSLAATLTGGAGRPSPARAVAALRQGGINVEPSARPWRYVGANPDSWWCVQPNCISDPTTMIQTELGYARQLGVADVRLEFPWFLIEPANGVYDWSRSDQIMTAAQNEGLTIQPVIVFTPAWAGANTTVAPPAADFSAFVTAFARRYDHQVPVIEMWNEADHGHYWNSGEAAYVNSILNPGYAAVKAVDPAIKVEVSGTANDPTANGWLAALYSLGAHYDVMSFHNYSDSAISEAQAIQTMMAAHADNRPIWLGEYSVDSTAGDQSALITSTLTAQAPIAMAQWYNLRDDTAYNCCPPVAAVSAHWGLMSAAYAPKPSFTTMQSLLNGSVNASATPSPSGTPTPAPAPAPSPVPSPAPTPSAAGGLHVSGNHLVDADGDTVLLHGADMAGTEFVCAQGWSADPFGGQPEDSAQTFAAMRSWNVNVVRVPLNEDCWLGINGVKISATTYRAAVIKLVSDLRAAGFYVIVDLHWSAPGGQLALSQNPAPDEDHSPSFWKSVAATFATDTGVIYDLYNEPFFYWIAPGGPDENTCLWSGCLLSEYETGGSPFAINATWRSAGFDELISDIRSTGASNVIMAAGTNWARDLSGWLAHRPADANTVASWHSYPSGNPSLLSECAAQWCWDQVIAPLARQVPVVVGETGDSAAGPETYLPAFLPYASAHGLNVVAWTWNAWSNPDDVLVTNMQTGAPTSGEGVMFRSWLASQPVAPAPSSSAPPPSPSPSPSSNLSSSPPSVSPFPSPPSPQSPAPGGTVLYSDNFAADAAGSSPAGWTSNGPSSTWSVGSENPLCVTHSGWTGNLVTGGPSWSNYELSVVVRPSAWASEADGFMFAMTGSNHYSVTIVGGNQLVLSKVVSGAETKLAGASYAFGGSTWYTINTFLSGGVVSVYVNSALVIQASDSTLNSGGIGLQANDPVSFASVTVTQLAAPVVGATAIASTGREI